MRKLIVFYVALILSGCAAQQWPAWTRTAAENDCYDRHLEAACYVAHQQETAAWAGANQQMAESFGPGTTYNPIHIKVVP